MAKRKATSAEVKELLETGRLAEGAAFDGVNYMVEVKSKGDTSGTDDKKSK